MASRPPRPGDPLTIAGYGPGIYRAVTGRCTQFYAPRMELPQELVELDVQARQGDSGGPIFNEQGELAGVLFGAGRGTTLGSFQGRVQTFLASLAPDIGAIDSAPQVAIRNVPSDCPQCNACPCCPSQKDGAICRDGRCSRSTDLGDVCFGCDQVAEHDASTKPPATDRQKPAADEWPSVNATLPKLNWSAGKPAERATADQAPVPHQRLDEQSPPSPPAGPLITSSLFENIKNGLAIVGVLAILLQLVRLAG